MSDVAERVKKIVVEHLGVDADKVTEKASFIDDLGADSLDTVELVMAFEEEFGIEIPDDAAEKIQTVEDAVNFIERSTPSRLTRSGGARDVRALRRIRCACARRRHRHRPGHAARLGRRADLEAADRRQVRLRAIQSFDVSDLPCKIAGQVPRGETARPATVQSRRYDVAQGAAADRRLHPLRDGRRRRGGGGFRLEARRPTRSASRTGVMIGSGIGGLQRIADDAHRRCTRRARAASARSSSRPR